MANRKRMIVDYLQSDAEMLERCATAHEFQRVSLRDHLTDGLYNDLLDRIAARESYVRAAHVTHEIGLIGDDPPGWVKIMESPS